MYVSDIYVCGTDGTCVMHQRTGLQATLMYVHIYRVVFLYICHYMCVYVFVYMCISCMCLPAWKLSTHMVIHVHCFSIRVCEFWLVDVSYEGMQRIRILMYTHVHCIHTDLHPKTFTDDIVHIRE
jgi:hypothetical protein